MWDRRMVAVCVLFSRLWMSNGTRWLTAMLRGRAQKVGMAGRCSKRDVVVEVRIDVLGESYCAQCDAQLYACVAACNGLLSHHCRRFVQVYELVPNEDAARGGGGGVSTKDLPKGANLSRRAATR